MITNSFKVFFRTLRKYLCVLGLFFVFIVACIKILFLLVAPLELQNDIHNVILGHSHSECSVNDALIEKTLNVSSSGEAYFYSCLKLRGLLKENRQIKNVYVEFSNNNLMLSKDSIVFDDKNISLRLPRYGFFMSFEELAYLSFKNPRRFLKSFPTVFKHNLKLVLSFRSLTFPELEWGGYLHHTKVYSPSTSKNENKTATVPKKTIAIALTENVKKLKEIEKLCQEKGVNLFFIRSPLYKSSNRYVPEEYFQKLRLEHFPHIRFYDFADFPLDDDCFADNSHLNYKGAEVFTHHFKNEVLGCKD